MVSKSKESTWHDLGNQGIRRIATSYLASESPETSVCMGAGWLEGRSQRCHGTLNYRVGYCTVGSLRLVAGRKPTVREAFLRKVSSASGLCLFPLPTWPQPAALAG